MVGCRQYSVGVPGPGPGFGSMPLAKSNNAQTMPARVQLHGRWALLNGRKWVLIRSDSETRLTPICGVTHYVVHNYYYTNYRQAGCAMLQTPKITTK